MKRFEPERRGVAALLILTTLASMGATWPPEKFTNLKVLPSDIPQRELIDLMVGFSRALDVRCTHCHVGEEGEPLTTYRFELDDKEPKLKAREMMRMVKDLNDEYLGSLERRADPPIRVECVTCHRGATEPRLLQDVLWSTHQAQGIDSTLAAYHALRARYHGGFTYDFGEESLSEVAARLARAGRAEDALRLHALNVEMNPRSDLAKGQHASAALVHAYRTEGVDAGARTYRRLREQYGPAAFPEAVLIQTGRRFLGAGRTELAIGVFQIATEAFPGSSNAFDGLGEACMKHGDRERAMRSYRKSLELDAANANARQKLEELTRSAKER